MLETIFVSLAHAVKLVFHYLFFGMMFSALLFFSIVVLEAETKTFSNTAKAISYPVTESAAKQVFQKVIKATDGRVRSVIFKVVKHNSINAFASKNTQTGERNIIVTTGLLNFVKNEHELAVIIGHELAHHMLGHLDSMNTNTRFNSSAYREAMADITGIALTKMSGYDPCIGSTFWTRMREEFGHRYETSTHPTPSSRHYNFEKFCGTEGK